MKAETKPVRRATQFAERSEPVLPQQLLQCRRSRLCDPQTICESLSSIVVRTCQNWQSYDFTSAHRLIARYSIVRDDVEIVIAIGSTPPVNSARQRHPPSSLDTTVAERESPAKCAGVVYAKFIVRVATPLGQGVGVILTRQR